MKQTNAKKRIWQRVAFIGSIATLVIAVSVSAVCLFQRFYYTPIWVNGQSMYPTFNKDAKYKDGNLIGETRIRGEEEGIYDVDYCFMATDQGVINNISRFNIIVCKYTYQQASYNIKRVIALPGEKFYFVNNPGMNDNGQLYICEKDQAEFKLVEQPIDNYYVLNGNYSGQGSTIVTLNENEYFVVGDNRVKNNSYDSRDVGPIVKSNILGVVAGINGKATLGYNNEGVFGPISVSHFWPKFL